MAHLDGDVVTLFWRFPSVLIQDLILVMLPIRPNQTRSVIGPNQTWFGTIGSPILAMLPILAMTSWDLRIDITPKKFWKCQIPILYGVSQITSRFTVDWYFLTRANIPPTLQSTTRGWWWASAKTGSPGIAGKNSLSVNQIWKLPPKDDFCRFTFRKFRTVSEK
jgi:hypothetical protein